MAKIKLQGEEEKRKNIYYEVNTDIPPIGEGGMGKVMKGLCIDIRTNISRPVAIKFLYDDLPTNAIERAKREASIRLRNDNLIEMLGFIETETTNGTHKKKHYHVVSELLYGIPLSYIFEGKCTNNFGEENPFAKKLLKDFLTDPICFAKKIILNVLSGLLALHDAGYIHRDIDPSNIMLTEDGHIKLIDFGIAKQVKKLSYNDKQLTTAGVFMGKAAYAAPELAIGDLGSQNQATDIYAMGILLYQCIVGDVPFKGISHIVLEKQLHKKIPLTRIQDPGMRKIIKCATNKNPNLRYQTAAQMRAAIESLTSPKKIKKSTIITVITICTIIAIIIGTYYDKKSENTITIKNTTENSQGQVKPTKQDTPEITTTNEVKKVEETKKVFTSKDKKPNKIITKPKAGRNKISDKKVITKETHKTTDKKKNFNTIKKKIVEERSGNTGRKEKDGIMYENLKGEK